LRLSRRAPRISTRRKAPVADLKAPLLALQQKPPAQAFAEIHALIVNQVRQRATANALSPDAYVASLAPDTKEQLDALVRDAAAARYAPATAQDVQRFSQQVYSLFKKVDREQEQR
jgi:hypothetical protein